MLNLLEPNSRASIGRLHRRSYLVSRDQRLETSSTQIPHQLKCVDLRARDTHCKRFSSAGFLRGLVLP